MPPFDDTLKIEYRKGGIYLWRDIVLLGLKIK
ncbi:MAG: hypothetical protein H6Q69_2736 [Firmicutes bacterium]|nr:hypothetical protein [Bacillota bacterium]